MFFLFIVLESDPNETLLQNVNMVIKYVPYDLKTKAPITPQLLITFPVDIVTVNCLKNAVYRAYQRKVRPVDITIESWHDLKLQYNGLCNYIPIMHRGIHVAVESWVTCIDLSMSLFKGQL